ncbi:ABC transporter permease [Rhodoblastus sp.]|uniref:ABC transporter permease n=1 Tax=Rhodoblastus sp. TaxID=1962975 RepID=UPI003F9BD6D7
MKQVSWTIITLLSHWRRRPANFAALFVGLAIATALWSGVQALNEHARESYERAASIFAGAGSENLVPAGGGAISQDLFVKLRLAGWKVSPALEGTVLIRGAPFQLIGIEPLTLPRGLQFGGLTSGANFAAFLTPPGQTVAAPETLRDLGAAEGAAIAVDGGKTLPPIRSSASAPPGVLVVDIAMAQALLDRRGQVSRLILHGKPQAGTPPLETVAGKALRLPPPGEEAGDMRRLTESFHANLTAFGLLACLVGFFIVHAAFGLAFEQRLAMVRTMRAVGVSARALVAAMLGELVLLALVAGSAGVAAGFWLASALLPNVAASLDALYGARVVGPLALDATWWLSGLGIALLGALVAAGGGLFKAFRLPVLMAAQPFAWRQAQQKFMRRRAFFASLAFAASLAAYFCGSGLYSGFAVIAGLLFGAALLLPNLLAGALRLGEKCATAPLAQWFWADSQQQLPGLSLALTALLLALATNVGVGGMVEGFRETFAHWLDERLAAEVYFEAAGAPEAQRIEAWLATRRDVTAVLPAAKTTIRLADWPTEVVGMKSSSETYRSRFPMLAQSKGAWDDVQRGDGALVSEQLARRLDLAVGLTLDLPVAGEIWRAKIVGIFPDYGNPKGQVRIDIDALARHWPGAPRVTYGLRVAPEAAPQLIAAMQNQFGPQIVRVTDQAAVKKISTRIFEHTFAVTAALNTLTLIVSAVALLASLSTLGNLRLAQLAPVWASGVPRRRLAQLEVLRILLLAAATASVALPLGLALAWCLVAVVNVQAFGWRLPFYIFPGQWAGVVVLALLTATVAAVAPILRLLRTTPAELAKVFANER